MLGKYIYRRENDTETSQWVSPPVAEANGTNRTSFSNGATESAATEIFAASTLPTPLGAVANWRIQIRRIWEELITQIEDNTYQITLATSVRNWLFNADYCDDIGYIQSGSLRTRKQRILFTTFDYPQLNPLTSMSSVQPSSQSLVSCRKD